MYQTEPDTFTLILVDSDVSRDQRVLRSIEEAAGSTATFDIRARGDRGGLLALFKTANVLFGALLHLRERYVRLADKLGGRMRTPFFAGMRACARWTYRAVRSSLALRSHVRSRENVVLHAHDLYCGVAAALAKGATSIPLIYDAHELEIHRNRRAGWLRVMIEHGLEQFVLGRATEVRAVNHAIAQLMRDWYDIPAQIRVTYNDFYQSHPAVVAPADAKPALVYVGMGMKGRQFEFLDQLAPDAAVDVHVFLLGGKLPPHIQGAGWVHGPVDYERSLVELVRSRRCLMWCCLENSCLSYEYATPNKFFQALAVGMPVVASSGTYLADIVQSHGIGGVFDGTNLRQLVDDAVGPRYEEWVAAAERLRARLKTGEMVI
jgi:glycosyltransferase involved in cell wall biosynthesis